MLTLMLYGWSETFRYILVGKKESYQVGLDEVERFKLEVLYIVFQLKRTTIMI